jgi:transglutaminase-like putative cysteine protease
MDSCATAINQTEPETAAMQQYLSESKYIDFDAPDVLTTARQLAARVHCETELVRACFEFVRDEICHSSDFKRNPVTCKASDVLRFKTGYCYAKSHLLAALLRANGIPTGLCYQRLSIGDSGAPYCLHGLNAVYLKEFGWYRIDARGNKPGIDAQFAPPREALAFSVREPQERDLPEIWAEPLAAVVEVLERYDSYDQVLANLPDIELTVFRTQS